MTRRLVILLVGIVSVGGCASSPPVDYFGLDMKPSGEATTEVGVEVEPFSTVGSLAGNRIYIQASPTRVEYYDSARWAAGVGELVQQKLGAELGTGCAGAVAVKVSGTVLAFGQVDEPSGGRSARVRLEVTIRSAATRRYEAPLHDAVYDATMPVTDGDVEALARALSRCVEEIASEIADEVAAIDG
jgi:ABC-type uncharacterized transport system auxiliary subunit